LFALSLALTQLETTLDVYAQVEAESPVIELLEPLEARFKTHFGEQWPIMYEVARCESSLRQLHDDWTPIVSRTRDFGIFQINEKTWDSTARKLGLDYKHSLEDNLKMAKIILDQQGIEAWKPSSKCHGYSAEQS